jgi:hypothetical protein
MRQSIQHSPHEAFGQAEVRLAVPENAHAALSETFIDPLTVRHAGLACMVGRVSGLIMSG